MKNMKIHSFNLPGKYIHILATSNVSFSFATQQFLRVNGFHPLGQFSRIFKATSRTKHSGKSN